MPIRNEGLRGSQAKPLNFQILEGEEFEADLRRRRGGVDPRRRADRTQISQVMGAIASGNLSDDQIEAMIIRNPRSANLFRGAIPQGRRIAREFTTPAQPAISEQPAQEASPFADPTAGAFADETVPGFEAQPQGLFSQEAKEAVQARAAVPEGFDVSGAAQQALREGNPRLAREFAAFDQDKVVDKQKLGKTQFKRADTLRDEHTKLAKTFIDVRDAYGRIIESGTQPSAAGDLSLIFNYMKMLDPDSVVRESEFATAAASGSLGDRFVAVGAKMLRGERLSGKQRLDFMSRSQRLYDRQLKTQRRLDGRYSKLSRNFGVPSNLVVQDFALERGADNVIKELVGRRTTKPIAKPTKDQTDEELLRGF